jgi:hypothetical protein
MLSIEFKDFRQLHEGVIFYGDTERRCLVEMIYSKNVVSILSSNRLCIELCSMRIVAANARVVRQTTSSRQDQRLGFGYRSISQNHATRIRLCDAAMDFGSVF